MAIRWDCHGVQPGISTLLPLFRDSLSSPPSLPPSRDHHPCRVPLRRSLFLSTMLARSLPPRSSRHHPLWLAVRVFLPRIHTYSLDHPPRPTARPFLAAVRPRRPFRLFCSQADSLPTEATVAGWIAGWLAGWLVGLSSFLYRDFSNRDASSVPVLLFRHGDFHPDAAQRAIHHFRSEILCVSSAITIDSA